MTEVKRKVTKAEWDQRVNLAACYRLVAMYGWDDLVFTHISARVPGPDHHFLINPYGMTFAEVTASSLVKVDLDGNKVMKSPFDINPAGFVIHSAIHAAREDAICVLHTHSLNGTAVSAQEQGILPLSQKSTFVLASLAYHDYEGLAVSADEKVRLVRDLGDKRFLMLRNHGLITIGETVADAFLFMYQFEAACAIQVRAQTSSGQFVLINPDVLATVSKRLKEVLRGTGGALVWPALLRTLDQSDKSYRS
jgi:ribulose-5-phosphate 4-epimerase/fuculose-1-phosphate aldolase